MKITIFAAGSRGDIQPCVALGRGLQSAGYSVRLAAPENFASFVQEHGVAFAPLRGDVQAIMASDTGRAFMESGGGNPLRSIRAIRELIAPVVMQMAQDLHAACEDADALICLGVFGAFGRCIAEARGIPVIHVEPTPLLGSQAFPAPSWPIQISLGGLHNALSGWAMLQVIWLWYRPFIAEFRAHLGLPPFSARLFHRGMRTTPLLSAYSPRIIPPPPDWPETTHITGYFFLDSGSGWQPPPGLEDFLAAGDPPVCIGFGSMSGSDPDRLAGIILEALELSGQRAVLLTGWGGLALPDGSESAFVLESAPHSWLFPHCTAVVHHGGAGTTAEGLRAGVPTVIVPFVLDQPFWGARVRAMGLGPAPIPQKRLTAGRLAAAIRQAVEDDEMRQRARACGQAIRAEDGVGSAVDLVRRYFGAPNGAEGNA